MYKVLNEKKQLKLEGFTDIESCSEQDSITVNVELPKLVAEKLKLIAKSCGRSRKSHLNYLICSYVAEHKDGEGIVKAE